MGLVELGFKFEWIENANQWSTQQMHEYPLVILAKSNNVSETDQSPWANDKVQRAFLEYVRSGNGLLVIHSGTAGYEQARIFRELIGGVFREHPEPCPVSVEPQAGHPIAEGSSPFTVVDEHYFMDLDDEQVNIFLTTSSQHGTQPGGWTRLEGEGRVCVLTPGHNLEVWEHPAYQFLLQNALHWCNKTL